MNGHKLTNNVGDTITVNANGNLTITGNGTVDNVTHGKAALSIKENGKATLNGGYFNRSKENGKGADDPGGNSYYTLINHGELIINDGAVVTTASGSSTLGCFSSLVENGYFSHNNSTYYPTLTIKGGIFKGGLNTIKNDDNGIINIYGGKCENYYQACVQNHHKATIYNGEFSTDVSSAWSVLKCGSCSSVDAIHDAHELVIKNGNFKGDVRANVGTVKIEGGSFESSFTKEGNATIEISGGTFKKDIDKSYIVDGKKLDANGNVVPDTITIIVPSEGGNTTTTPSTDNTKNPSTGANVDMRFYRVIYDAIDEIEAAMKGMLAPKFEEVVIGHAEVRMTYKVSAIGTIAGCMVKDGKVTRDSQVRVLRDNIVIHEGEIGSLQRFKDAVKEVTAGYECGMSVVKYNDIKEGDIFECFVMQEVKR